MFALSQLARPPAGSASIDVLASDAVATKGLTAIFVPFVADTISNEAAGGPIESRHDSERVDCGGDGEIGLHAEIDEV